MHGPEIARQQCEYERANQEDLSSFIKAQGLADVVDLIDYRSADCYMTEETWERGLASYQGFSKVGGNVKDINVLTADEAREVRSTVPAMRRY